MTASYAVPQMKENHGAAFGVLVAFGVLAFAALAPAPVLAQGLTAGEPAERSGPLRTRLTVGDTTLALDVGADIGRALGEAEGGRAWRLVTSRSVTDSLGLGLTVTGGVGRPLGFGPAASLAFETGLTVQASGVFTPGGGAPTLTATDSATGLSVGVGGAATDSRAGRLDLRLEVAPGSLPAVSFEGGASGLLSRDDPSYAARAGLRLRF